MVKIINKYIEENRGFVTASKLKEFIKSPESYFLKFIKEVEPLKVQDKACFRIGTAIDDLICYGKNEFDKKYFIDEGLKKADLEKKLFAIGVDTKGMLVGDMLTELYGDLSKKIKLTKLEGEQVFGMFNEYKRQPLFDLNGGYECQKTFIGNYKTLKLKGTLDRYKPGMLRDMKSSGDLKKFIWQWKNDFSYDVSMAFYWVLTNKATGDKPRLIFDVAQKNFPHPSRVYEIPQGEIINIIEQTIIPALETLNACMIAWEKTKDENIWKIKTDFKNIMSCDMYPIMDTAIQTEAELLQ